MILANQYRLLLSAGAYVLMEHLHRTALEGTELQAAQANTIRLTLLKGAARVVLSVQRDTGTNSVQALGRAFRGSWLAILRPR